MRPIDADALLKAFADFPYGYRGMIKLEIENTPTIDAVPIIRCKDCKHFHVYEVSDIKLFQCERVRMNVILMDEDDYCSRAERKVKSSVYE